MGSAVQLHAAAPWRAWQSIIPALMATTQSPDTDSLFSSTPQLRAQLAQLPSTLSQQMNKPTSQLKPLGAALRLQTTQKTQVSTIQRNIHRQFYNSLTDTATEQAILLAQSTSHTGAHLMQPRSEADEIEDRCFRVSVARRLMLPHPVAADPADVVQFGPNKSAAGVICNKPLDPKLHHCYGCRYGGGVDRRHAALTRCLADIIQSHSGVKVFIEQEVPALTRVVNGQPERARMDLVFNLHGSITYLDVSIVAPFSCNPSLVAAASTKPGLMAKRAEKAKFDRYPHINLVPFILETTGRPGSHARKFINYLLRDADNPPIAVRGHLVHHPERSPQCHLQTTTYGCRYVILGDYCHTQFVLCAPCLRMQVPTRRERTQPFSVSSTLQWCHVAPAVTSPLLTMMSTIPTTISSSCLRTLALCPICLTV